MADAISTRLGIGQMADAVVGIYELMLACNSTVGETGAFNTNLIQVGTGVKAKVEVTNEVTVKIAEGQEIPVIVKNDKLDVKVDDATALKVHVENEDIIVTPSEEAVFNTIVKNDVLNITGAVDATIDDTIPISVSVDNDLPIDVNVANDLPIDVNVANADDIDVNVNNIEPIDISGSVDVSGTVTAIVSGIVSTVSTGTANVLVVNSTDAPLPTTLLNSPLVKVDNFPMVGDAIRVANTYADTMYTRILNDPLTVVPIGVTQVSVSGKVETEDTATHGYLSAYNQAALRHYVDEDGHDEVAATTVMIAPNHDDRGKLIPLEGGLHQAKSCLLVAQLI